MNILLMILLLIMNHLMINLLKVIIIPFSYFHYFFTNLMIFKNLKNLNFHHLNLPNPVNTGADVAGPEFVVFERQHLRGYRRREPARRRETLRFRGDEPRRARRCR